MKPDHTLLAAMLICAYAVVIAFTDNFVRVIAAEAGLWQFHAVRSAMALALVAALAAPLGLRLWPRNLRAVAARSAVHGGAMLIYFGALAFLPVAQVAAGLFTAPIFVLLIGRLAYGQTIGPAKVLAVAIGFLGVVLVLGPQAMAGATLAAVVPVLAGALYAMGNIATRQWCAEERPEAMTAGFFAAMGVLGLVGLVVLAFVPLNAAPGPDGFVLRGWVWPSGAFWFWTFVQAAGSLAAVAMVVAAYQMADTGRVSVFEYAVLPASAMWGWMLWGEIQRPMAFVGMALIAGAGAVIALTARQSPTASRQ